MSKKEVEVTPVEEVKKTPNPKKNEYGQYIAEGDIIYFTKLYSAVSGGFIFDAEDTEEYKSYIETIMVDGKKIKAFKAKVRHIYKAKDGNENPYEVFAKDGKNGLGRTRPSDIVEKD